jgi:U3 small nucleolar RNA-associated protein 21
LEHTLIKEFILNSFPHQIEINRDNDLVCTSLENNNIFIYDKSQLALVRKFKIIDNDNEENYIINDIGISKDSNWLLCITSKDKSLRIFDIISTNLIEWVTFDKIPLSMCLSPNALYVAMSFQEEKGIYLYINRTLFVDLEDIEVINEPVHCSLATFKAKMLKEREDYDINNDNEKNVDGDGDGDIDEREKFIDIPEENNKLISLSTENNIKY